MEDKVLPQSAEEVLELLDGLFPENSGNPEWTHGDFMFRAGQRSVVRFLYELRKRRDEALMKDFE